MKIKVEKRRRIFIHNDGCNLQKTRFWLFCEKNVTLVGLRKYKLTWESKRSISTDNQFSLCSQYNSSHIQNKQMKI
jgi:hypothetical protein